jgi:hypothetical protein
MNGGHAIGRAFAPGGFAHPTHFLRVMRLVLATAWNYGLPQAEQKSSTAIE